MVVAAAEMNFNDTLNDEDRKMTVEQYLQKQCTDRVERLKRHMESLIDEFTVEAKKARSDLADIASQANEESSSTVDQEATSSEAPLCEAFALVGINGFHVGKMFKLEPTKVVRKWSAGRSEESHACLAGDDEASSRHAEVVFEGKQFKLQDLGSTNGTFVTTTQGKTKRLAKAKHVLKNGHLITFGSTMFVWCRFADAHTYNEAASKKAGTEANKSP